jgi:hypothetical protein
VPSSNKADCSMSVRKEKRRRTDEGTTPLYQAAYSSLINPSCGLAAGLVKGVNKDEER